MVKAYIRSTGSYIPEKVITNDELAAQIDTSDEWIVSHTGIKRRHIATPDQASSDLGIKAAAIAIEQAGLTPADIDMIICPTATPDHPGFPSTACIIQGKIGAVNASAFDITAACSGFVYALEIGSNLIRNQSMKNILVVAAEVMSRVVNWKDRNTCVLFGDGAGAVILSPSDDNNDPRGILFSMLGAEGEGAEYAIIPVGGTKKPYRHEEHSNSDEIFLAMNGQKVYEFAVRALTKTIKTILEKNNMGIDDIQYIIPHQANIRIIEAASKRLHVPLEKFYINIQEYANTTAATIPIALDEMNQKKLLKKGNHIITVGFGGGLTYGGNLICW